MLLSAGTSNDLSAARWNGTSFINITTITLNAANANEERFSFSWEGNTSNGVLVWGEGTAGAVNYSFWNDTTKEFIAGGSVTNRGATVTVQQIFTCSDPLSQYIGLAIGPDSTDDVLMAVWNGTGWQGGVPNEETNAENIVNKNAVCAWTKNTSVGLFAFADLNVPDIEYLTYNKTENDWYCPKNGQAVTDLTNAQGSNGPCLDSSVLSDDIEFIKMTSDPNSNDIMLILGGLNRDLESFIFNNTGLTQPTDGLLNSTISCTTF